MKISQFLAVLLLSVTFFSLSLESDIESQSSNSLMSIAIPPEKHPVVSAILLRCPKGAKRKKTKKPNSEDGQKEQICEQQLIVNVRVNPSFHVEKLEKFLILDEVYDPKRCSKAKIMSPYLIEISRGEPIMMYPLEFSKNVQCESCESDKDKDKDDDDDSDVEAGTCHSSKTTCAPNNSKNEKGEDKTTSAPKSPADSSLDKVIQKIASAFSSATRIAPQKQQSSLKNQKVPHRFSPDQLKQDYNDIEEKKVAEDQYDDEQSDESCKEKKDSKKEIIEKSAFRRSDTDSNSDKYEKSQFHNNIENKKPNNLVNVGIESKFYKQLEKHHIGQLTPLSPRYREAQDDSDTNIERHTNRFTSDSVKENTNSELYKEPNNRKNAKLISLPVYEAEDARKVNNERQSKAVPSKTVRQFRNNKTPQLNSFQPQAAQQQHLKELNVQHHFEETHEQLKPQIQQDEKHLLEKRGKFSKKKLKNKQQLKENDFRNYKNFGDRITEHSIQYYSPKKVQNFKPMIFKHMYPKTKMTPYLTENEISEISNENENLNENVNEQANNLHAYQDLNDMENNVLDNEETVEESVENDEFGADEHNAEEAISNYNIQKAQNDKRKVEQPPLEKLELEHIESLPNSFKQDNSNDFKMDDTVSYEDSVASLLSNDFDDNDMMQESGRVLNYMQRNMRRPSKVKKNKLKSSNSQQNNQFRGSIKNVKNKNQKESVADYHERKLYEKYNSPSPVLVSNPAELNKVNSLNKYQPIGSDNAVQNEQQEVNNNKNRIDARVSIYEKDPLFDFYKHMDELKSSDLYDGNKKILDTRNNLKLNEDRPLSNEASYSMWDNSNSIPSVERLNTLYTDIPQIETHGKDDSIIYHKPLIPPRSSAMYLISKEPSKFLPKKIPYEGIIDDPNLNTVEKMKVLEVLDPSNGDQYTRDSGNERKSDRYKIYTKPYTAASPHHSFSKRSLMDKNLKQKRSFMLYDDLELHNTLDDNDYNFDGMEHKKSVQNPLAMQQMELDNDVQSCSSCGGKNKKPVGKTPNNPSSGDNSCKCRPQRAPKVKSSTSKSLTDSCIQNECALAVPHDENSDISETPKHLVEDCAIDNPEQLVRNLCQRESLDFVLVPCRHIPTRKSSPNTEQ